METANRKMTLERNHTRYLEWERSKIRTKAIINCGGPWVSEILHERIHENSKDGIRLVRGSYIVTKKLFEHDKSYIFQQSDGRIIFAIPYEDDHIDRHD